MSYIGASPTTVAFLTDQFSGNGSTTAFTMSVAPATTTSVLVSVTGVLQDPTTYSVVGTTLTFSAAPPSGTGNISVRYLGIPASGVTTTAYRTVTEFTATSGQTTFTPPSYTVGFINVFRNGVRLGSADFTASNGTTVVLTTGATTGDLVVTESFYVSSVLNAIPATAGAINSTYLADANVTQAKLAANVAGNGPAFSAFRTGSEQAITSGVWTKVQLNTENFDTANCFDNTTNYRFTPTSAGYYQVNFAVYASAGTYTGVLAALYKNGVPYLNSSNYATSAALDDWSVSGSVLLFMNGSTDYIELYAYLVGTASIGNNTYTHMDAYLARSA
jgi:hypothetical protein